MPLCLKCGCKESGRVFGKKGPRCVKCGAIVYTPISEVIDELEGDMIARNTEAKGNPDAEG